MSQVYHSESISTPTCKLHLSTKRVQGMILLFAELLWLLTPGVSAKLQGHSSKNRTRTASFLKM